MYTYIYIYISATVPLWHDVECPEGHLVHLVPWLGMVYCILRGQDPASLRHPCVTLVLPLCHPCVTLVLMLRQR